MSQNIENEIQKLSAETIKSARIKIKALAKELDAIVASKMEQFSIDDLDSENEPLPEEYQTIAKIADALHRLQYDMTLPARMASACLA